MSLCFSHGFENKWKLIACLESERRLWSFLLDIWYWEHGSWALARAELYVTQTAGFHWETLLDCFLEHFGKTWVTMPVSTGVRPCGLLGNNTCSLPQSAKTLLIIKDLDSFVRSNGMENPVSAQVFSEESQNTLVLPPHPTPYRTPYHSFLDKKSRLRAAQ